MTENKFISKPYKKKLCYLLIASDEDLLGPAVSSGVWFIEEVRNTDTNVHVVLMNNVARLASAKNKEIIEKGTNHFDLND